MVYALSVAVNVQWSTENEINEVDVIINITSTL